MFVRQFRIKTEQGLEIISFKMFQVRQPAATTNRTPEKYFII